MATVLLIESDVDTAEEWGSRFAELGYGAHVERDPDAAVAWAASQQPSLILLAVELDGTNGYLVCQNLRRLADTRDIPLVLMAEDATEDEFEKHRTLRTRADAYLHKPLSFEALWTHVSRFLPDTGSTEQGVMVEDDDLFIVDMTQTGTLVQPRPDSLKPPRQASEKPALDLGLDDADDDGATQMLSSDHAAFASLRPATPEPEASAQVADSAPTQMTEPPRSLRHSVVAAPVNAARPQALSSATSREFLDLRELLNRKDRELLDLRDQLSVRDKQVLAGRDRTLGLERAQTDLQEKNIKLERELTDLRESLESTTQDKELASKRAETVKNRLEAAEARIKKLEEQSAEEVKRHRAEAEALSAQHAKSVAAREQEHDMALTTLLAEHRDAVAQMKDGYEAQLGRLEETRAREVSAIQETRVREVAAIEAQRAHEVAALEEARVEQLSLAEQTRARQVAELEAGHARALERERETLEARHGEAVALLRDEHSQEVQGRLAEAEHRRREELLQQQEDHMAALVRLRQELDQAHAAEVRVAEEQHAREFAQLGRRLAETDTRLGAVSQQLETEKSAARDLEDRLTEKIALLETELESAQRLQAAMERKLATDAEILERVRKAMAVSVSLLDEQRRNRVES